LATFQNSKRVRDPFGLPSRTKDFAVPTDSLWVIGRTRLRPSPARAPRRHSPLVSRGNEANTSLIVIRDTELWLGLATFRASRLARDPSGLLSWTKDLIVPTDSLWVIGRTRRSPSPPQAPHRHRLLVSQRNEANTSLAELLLGLAAFQASKLARDPSGLPSCAKNLIRRSECREDIS
jgi:hypothetical protein